jgi:hypothetical protein
MQALTLVGITHGRVVCDQLARWSLTTAIKLFLNSRYLALPAAEAGALVTSSSASMVLSGKEFGEIIKVLSVVVNWTHGLSYLTLITCTIRQTVRRALPSCSMVLNMFWGNNGSDEHRSDSCKRAGDLAEQISGTYPSSVYTHILVLQGLAIELIAGVSSCQQCSSGSILAPTLTPIQLTAHHAVRAWLKRTT